MHVFVLIAIVGLGLGLSTCMAADLDDVNMQVVHEHECPCLPSVHVVCVRAPDRACQPLVMLTVIRCTTSIHSLINSDINTWH